LLPFRIADKPTFVFRGVLVQFVPTFRGFLSRARHLICASEVNHILPKPLCALLFVLLSILHFSHPIVTRAEIQEKHSQLAASQKCVAQSTLPSLRAPRQLASHTIATYTHQRYYNYSFSTYCSYSLVFQAIHCPSIEYTNWFPFLQPTTEVDFSFPTVWCPRALCLSSLLNFVIFPSGALAI
jgi:hypothetical protein